MSKHSPMGDPYPIDWSDPKNCGAAAINYTSIRYETTAVPGTEAKTIYQNADAATLKVKRNKPNFLWNEEETIGKALDYIINTYREHYGQDTLQVTQIIDDAGHGHGFMMGNILKYAKRYGKKDGFNQKDLLKIIHYAVMAIHIHERDHNTDGN